MNVTYIYFWENTVDRMIESEVDHVENSITSNCARQPFIQPVQADSMSFNDLLRNCPSAWNFLKIKKNIHKTPKQTLSYTLSSV